MPAVSAKTSSTHNHLLRSSKVPAPHSQLSGVRANAMGRPASVYAVLCRTLDFKTTKWTLCHTVGRFKNVLPHNLIIGQILLTPVFAFSP